MVIAPELEFLAYNSKSILRTYSSATKFFILLIYLFLNLFLTMPLYLPFFCMVLVIFYLSKVPLKFVKKPLIIAFFTGFFVFLAKLHYLKTGTPFNILIDFYPESFIKAFLGGARIVTGVILVITFISVTPIRDFLSLLYKLKFPVIFIEIFLIIFKYIFILNDEGLKMKNAQTVRLGYKGFKRSLESFGNLVGMILIRGINRGCKISDALYVRGYNGKIFYPGEIVKPKSEEYIIVLLFGLIPLFIGIFYA